MEGGSRHSHSHYHSHHLAPDDDDAPVHQVRRPLTDAVGQLANFTKDEDATGGDMNSRREIHTEEGPHAHIMVSLAYALAAVAVVACLPSRLPTSCFFPIASVVTAKGRSRRPPKLGAAVGNKAGWRPPGMEGFYGARKKSDWNL